MAAREFSTPDRGARMRRLFLRYPRRLIEFLVIALIGGSVGLGGCATAEAPRPPAPVGDPIEICVIDPGSPGGIRTLDALVLPGTRDTAVVVDGRVQPLVSVLPSVMLATDADWLVGGEPLMIPVADWHPIEFEVRGADLVMQPDELVYLGLVDGLPVYGAAEEWADFVTELESLRDRLATSELGALLADDTHLRDALGASHRIFIPLTPVGCVFLPLGQQLPATANGGGEEDVGFFWPIPEPSASMVIGRDVLDGDDDVANLGDIARRIKLALDGAEYFEYRYYEIPGGIAMVTRLERIHANGMSAAGDERWNLGSPRNVSLRALLAGLFRGNPGHFRIIAFIVTDDPPGPGDFAPDSVTLDEADRWFQGGWHTLRPELAERPYTSAHEAIALIYEFHQGSIGDSAAIVRPSGIQGRTHLERARILVGLER